MPDMLLFLYRQFSDLSYELSVTRRTKAKRGVFISEVDTAFARLHTHSSVRTQRKLETHIQHSIVLSSYLLGVAVQSYPRV